MLPIILDKVRSGLIETEFIPTLSLTLALKVTVCVEFAELLREIDVSLAEKEEIVGAVLSVCSVVTTRLSVELLPAASVTVNVTVLLILLFKVGLEKLFVNVYVLPLTLDCIPPLIPMEAIDTLSLTIAVKEAVLLLELPEEYQVSVELLRW